MRGLRGQVGGEGGLQRGDFEEGAFCRSGFFFLKKVLLERETRGGGVLEKGGFREKKKKKKGENGRKE